MGPNFNSVVSLISEKAWVIPSGVNGPGFLPPRLTAEYSMKSDGVFFRQRSITSCSTKSAESSRKSSGNANLFPVFSCVTNNLPSLISLNLNNDTPSLLCPVTSARSQAFAAHSEWAVAASLIISNCSSRRRSRFTLGAGVLVGSAGFLSICSSTITSLKISNNTERRPEAIAPQES